MVSKQKQQTVQELKQLVKEYPIVGVVDMQSLPAPQCSAGTVPVETAWLSDMLLSFPQSCRAIIAPTTPCPL